MENTHVVDLDHPRGTPAAGTDLEPAAQCSCGERRTILRHQAVSPCAGRALARLKEAHRDEYDRYLAELKAEALAEFEAAWQRHMAGQHRRQNASAAPQQRGPVPDRI